jgi:hypothetical protein
MMIFGGFAFRSVTDAAEAGRADLGVESKAAFSSGSLPRGGRRWVARGDFVTAEGDGGVVRADGTEKRSA